MNIKPGLEEAYAKFADGQRISEDGQTLLNFMETWSSMMEFVMEQDVDSVTEIAGITVETAAAEAGVLDDQMLQEGAEGLAKFWEWGNALEEWVVYHPPEILADQPHTFLPLWDASPELLEAMPAFAEAYPNVLDIHPNLLEDCQNELSGRKFNSFSMSM